MEPDRPTRELSSVPTSDVRVFRRRGIAMPWWSMRMVMFGVAVLVAFGGITVTELRRPTSRSGIWLAWSMLAVGVVCVAVPLWSLWRSRREQLTFDFDRRVMVAEWIYHDRSERGRAWAPGWRRLEEYRFDQLLGVRRFTSRANELIIETDRNDLYITRDGFEGIDELDALAGAIAAENLRDPVRAEQKSGRDFYEGRRLGSVVIVTLVIAGTLAVVAVLYMLKGIR